MNNEDFLASLIQIRDAARQRAWIAGSGVAPTLETIGSLSHTIRDMCPRDPALAEVLAETNTVLAAMVNGPAAWAYANRSKAHVLYTRRHCLEAQPYFETSVRLFLEAGMAAEAGRTMVGEMDNLSFLSRFEDAVRLEEQARAALETAADSRYLTILEIALGNLYYRLNQYERSRTHYESALASSDDPVSTAAAGMGRAHVLTDLNRFDEAIETFENTKRHCAHHSLTLWADIADRGISRMHFLRGNYSNALGMIEQVRRRHEAAGDSRRVAYCDLDRAEIYLQLNLFEDAATLARKSHTIFDELGNRHEAAMARLFLGIAEFKLLHDGEAEKAFLQGRAIFEESGNQIWCAAVDMWRAQLLIRQKKFVSAHALATRCAEIFDTQHVPVRAANARVLSAQSLQELDPPDAVAHARQALADLQGFHAPWVSYQAFNTLGRLQEQAGENLDAEISYVQAAGSLGSLRGSIRLDELRMSFSKDKYRVYENIVNLQLNRGDSHSAFDYVERSKSRTLIDLLERNLETVWKAGAEGSPRLQKIQKIREELNILYNRLEGDVPNTRAAAIGTSTRSEITSREHELMETLREEDGSVTPGWTTLQNMELPRVQDVQQILADDELLIEYYAIGEYFQAIVIARNEFHVVRNLTTDSAVRTALKGLNFQLSKFHLQPDYVARHRSVLLAASVHHLRDLYRQLIAPIQAVVKFRPKLIVVPHQALHYVPFHALEDGERYVIDNHEISYAASASVLKICRERKPLTAPLYDLILAVSDESTPFIDEEVEGLRSLLSNAKIFVGAEAREDKLRTYAPSAGIIHIAAHGVFRADNPMFSSLKLGDRWLNLFDIFNLQLGAELTTLSACETGMNGIWEGDELLGLAAGFLYAGTPSLVVSLWTVNDRSTSQLMQKFYKGLKDGQTKSLALRNAILEVKKDFPHPYFWAPFILLGKS